MTGLTVLYADPDDPRRETTTADLRAEIGEATVIPASSIAGAKDVLRDRAVDCVVTEYEFPGGTGLDLVEHVRGFAPDTGCILFTGVGREAIDTTAFEGALTEYLDRSAPGSTARLAHFVRTTVDLRSQAAYPLPEGESVRLDVLDRYTLDSGSLREAVDRITDLAAAHFGVPVASVNLIAEHTQEILACRGADWETMAREDSICTYTILEGDVTVVEDVDEDVRFADNEALDEMGITFYAGAPLTFEGSARIGTLCIYDDEPRSLDDDGRAYLRLLADELVHQIELHQRLGRADAPAGEGS